MPRVTIHVGAQERLEPAVTKATVLGALGTEALAWIGATSIRGRAAAMRALAGALVEAAELGRRLRRRPGRLQRARAGRARPRRLA